MYPRRVRELQNKLQEINGDKITAAQSRQLIKTLAETQFDLWDKIIEQEQTKKKVDEMYPAFKLGKWLFVLLATTNIVFVVQQILSHILGGE